MHLTGIAGGLMKASSAFVAIKGQQHVTGHSLREAPAKMGAAFHAVSTDKDRERTEVLGKTKAPSKREDWAALCRAYLAAPASPVSSHSDPVFCFLNHKTREARSVPM